MAKQTLKSIERQIAKLKAVAEKLVAKDKTPAIRQITALMAKSGVTIADLRAAGGKRKVAKRAGAKRGTVAPKYRNPIDGATWTGRGRTPVWLVEAEKTGALRTQFLISNAA